jgi:hypothetical protein
MALGFVGNVWLRNQRRSVFIASKIKVLKLQTAEAAAIPSCRSNLSEQHPGMLL